LGIIDLETCFKWLQLTRSAPSKKKTIK
jgi:hypothetical protein